MLLAAACGRAFAMELDGPTGPSRPPTLTLIRGGLPASAVSPVIKLPVAYLQLLPPLAAAPPQARAASTQAGLAKMDQAIGPALQAIGKAETGSEGSADAGRLIERTLTGETEAPSDYMSVYLQGLADGTIQTGPRLEPTGKTGEYRVKTPPLGLSPARERTLNPGDVYAEAYEAASRAARRMGLNGRVHFAEATGTLPLTDGKHATFSFYPAGPTAGAKVIAVEFSRSPVTEAGHYAVRVAVRDAGDEPRLKLWPTLDDGKGYPYLAKGFWSSPESALDGVRRNFPQFGASAAFSARITDDAETGDVDPWYHFLDDAGRLAGVNARTGDTRLLKDLPKPPWTLGAWLRSLVRP